MQHKKVMKKYKKKMSKTRKLNKKLKIFVINDERQFYQYLVNIFNITSYFHHNY